MNKKALEIIREFEGERLVVYADPIGLLTVGIGHLCKPEEGYRLRQVITKEESERLLAQDVKAAEDALKTLVKVPLNENEEAALLSFTYNLGVANLRKSTLLRLLNQDLRLDASQEFLKWNKAGGRILKGLTRRRDAERRLFLSEA